MQVACYHGQHDIRVEDVEMPEMGPDEVRVEIEAAGVCGTDLHEYEAGPIFCPQPGEPNPQTGAEPPLPLGHEFGGIIDKVGSNVTEYSVGDVVAINPCMACQDCRFCNEGQYRLCEEMAVMGIQANQGGLSEYLTAPTTNVHKMPDDVPAEWSGMIEPLAVALNTVRKSDMKIGDTVAVFGAGPIGTGIIQCADVAGAENVIVSEPREVRRDLAEKCGADMTIDPTATDAVETIKDATDGGADATIEVSGTQPGLDDAYKSCVPGGQITQVSITEEPLAVDHNDLVLAERNHQGVFAYPVFPKRRAFDRVINLIDKGQIDPGVMITGRIDLEDVVEDGFEELLDPESDQVKILVKP